MMQEKMEKNMGIADRALRAAVAALLFFGAWSYGSLILFLFGVFTIYEALSSWCVLYQALGINHCPIDDR